MLDMKQIKKTSLIEIDGQSTTSICGSNSITINKTFPPIFENRVSNSSWNQFCEEADRVLEPMARIKRMEQILDLLKSLTILAALAFFTITTTGVVDLGYSIVLLASISIFAPVALFYSLKKLKQRVSSRRHNIVKNMKKFCTKKSSEYPQISFCLAGDNTTFGQGRFTVTNILSIYIDVLDGGKDDGSNMSATISELSDGKDNTKCSIDPAMDSLSTPSIVTLV